MKIAAGLKKYSTNIGILFLDKLIRAIVVLTVWALVIRYLGPERFGLFSYALSFVFLFISLSNLGLDNIVVRNLVKGGDSEEEILGSAFFLKLLGSILAILLIFVSVKIFRLDSYTSKLILILSFRLIFLPFNCIDFYFQSQVVSKYTIYASTLALLCTSILFLFFIHLELSLIYFVFVVVIESAILAMGLVIFYKVKQKIISAWKFKLDIIKKLIKYSWPLIISGAAIAIYTRIDQIMIKAMLNTVSVGYYSAAIRISEAFYCIPLIITGSLFPAIIKAKSIGKIIYQRRLILLSSILLWISLVIMVFVTFTSVSLIKILYGQEYLPAAGVLSLHIWAMVFVSLSMVRSRWAITENLQVYIMFYALFSIAVNILLNLFLIPAWGIKGAAVATVISRFIAEVLSNLFSKKTRPIFILQLRSVNFFRVAKQFFGYKPIIGK